MTNKITTPAGFSRRAALGLGGGAAIAGLVGCGGSTPPSNSSKITVEKSVVDAAKPFKGSKLGILAQKQYAQSANTAFTNAIAAFSKATGTSVTSSTIEGDTGDLVAKTDAAIKAGNNRDMAFVDDGRFLAEFHELGDLEDVTDVVEELKKTWGEPSPEAQLNCVFDGKWYGIPYYFIGQGMFARKDWFADKGIKTKEYYSYEELRDICLEISDPTKKRYGWGMTVNRSGDANGMIEGVINCYGGAMTDNTGRKVKLYSSETIDGVSFLADIFTSPKYKPMLPPGIGSWTDSSNNENWLAGIVGVINNQFSVYADSKAQKNPVYKNTQSFIGCTGPATDTPLSAGASEALVVFKGAKNAGLAKVLAQYLMHGDALLDIAKDSTGLVLPAWKKVWDSDSFYTNGDPAFTIMRDMQEAPLPHKTTTGYTFPSVPSAGRQAANQSYVLTDMMQRILKGMSVKQSVQQANDDLIKIFEQQGVKQ
ncbi:ABC transporter substrate-binding protein [Microlunatus endophyticus]|uniref:ABC transporter substrate-binding protein n=1 Tax=Microlunatus endophyticus TaxID=1716077 RepID=A0A917S915_9ACTN|nr:extracellular solute-binding protein [Microlunatus endophyticus]GGL64501.1 ABC transporter substrate-binding protein [Microlunatus endophyticus]